MKLLTRLRELRNENTVDRLFDDFYFTVELNQAELMRRDEVVGIGTTTYDDIHRLTIENSDFNKQ